VSPAVITGIEMATSLASDGSAVNPRTTFSAASDPKIIAVVSLKDTVVGTTIKYVHIHGTSFTQSATFTLKKPLNHFYVQFAAPTGGTLVPGHYSLRFYVDGHEAGSISYDIT
jgi:hypothetical protein